VNVGKMIFKIGSMVEGLLDTFANEFTGRREYKSKKKGRENDKNHKRRGRAIKNSQKKSKRTKAVR